MAPSAGSDGSVSVCGGFTISATSRKSGRKSPHTDPTTTSAPLDLSCFAASTKRVPGAWPPHTSKAQTFVRLYGGEEVQSRSQQMSA